MSTQSRLSDAHLPGNALRNAAIAFLEDLFGEGQAEYRICGKKADAYFEVLDLGKRTRLYVESKDYVKKLSRKEVALIWSDYSGIIERNAPSTLLLITRNGLSADAEAFVGEQAAMRHLTIWDLEDEVLGLTPYLRVLAGAMEEGGLATYYIPARASEFVYDELDIRQVISQSKELLGEVLEWRDESVESRPLAILGGYGAGKTSFSRALVSYQARQALQDPLARRPVLLKLGSVARYSDLDGLLGSLFTSEHSVRGYSFSRFADFNRRGRLLIVLDGFDEMKHAMTWGDFRAQIQELNRLMCSQAKVVLLGRPSAFLSEAEHALILRGRHRTAVGTNMRLPDWPEFREFELSGFNQDEIHRFIESYLSYLEDSGLRPGRQGAADERARRADVVAQIVSVDEALFSRPVHIKLLVEIATSDSSSLERLEKDISRWGLYETFFSMLVERENLKEARRAIPDEVRLTFMQRLATWLWRDRDGATYFSVGDLPEAVLSVVSDSLIDDPVARARELLSGSFLEKKSGDVFYFPHRSFAEFLVAHGVAARPPSAVDHANNAKLFRDGVAEFLTDRVSYLDLAEWAESFSGALFLCPYKYLRFLCAIAGSAGALADAVLPGSHWRGLLRVLGDDIERSGEVMKRARAEMIVGSDLSVSLIVELIRPGGLRGHDAETRPEETAAIIIAALLSKLMLLPRERNSKGQLIIFEQEGSSICEMVQACIGGPDVPGGDFLFRWDRLIDLCASLLSIAGLGVVGDDNQDHLFGVRELSVHSKAVIAAMPRGPSEAMRELIGLGLKIVDIVSVQEMDYNHDYGITGYLPAMDHGRQKSVHTYLEKGWEDWDAHEELEYQESLFPNDPIN